MRERFAAALQAWPLAWSTPSGTDDYVFRMVLRDQRHPWRVMWLGRLQAILVRVVDVFVIVALLAGSCMPELALRS